MSEHQIPGPIARAIAELHRSPYKVVIATTGGGAGLQNLLWQQPGASATLLDSALLQSGMPYDRFALIDLIGHEPEHYCSESTALWMASAAHRRARELMLRAGADPRHAIGFGLTAALATDADRRGSDRVYVATRTDAGGLCVERLSFPKGKLNRQKEGEICDCLGLDAIFQAAGIVSPVIESSFRTFDPRHAGVRPIWPLASDAPLFHEPVFWPGGERGARKDLDPKKHVIFPGSFDPLHFGHELMAMQMDRMTDKKVVYAITDTHPDKGRIPEGELLRRAEQFRYRAPVIFTSADPLYIDKARTFPGFGMLIGADAALGLLDPKYYGGGNVLLRNEMLREMRDLGTRLYVVGRKVGDRFVTMDDLPIPAGYESLFVPVTGRWDVRSRDLR